MLEPLADHVQPRRGRDPPSLKEVAVIPHDRYVQPAELGAGAGGEHDRAHAHRAQIEMAGQVRQPDRTRARRRQYLALEATGGDVLVDDQEKHRHRWEGVGGIFIHHRSARETLAELRPLFPGL